MKSHVEIEREVRKQHKVTRGYENGEYFSRCSCGWGKALPWYHNTAATDSGNAGIEHVVREVRLAQAKEDGLA